MKSKKLLAAALATVMCNHLGIDVNPFILRDKLHQVKFNLDGVFVFCQPKQIGNALNMRIHHHTGDMIPISAHNICRFSADTRKGSQLLDIRGNLSIIVKGIADAFAENHGNSGKHGSGNYH